MLQTMELGLGAIGLEIKIWKSFTQKWCWKGQFGRNCTERKQLLEEAEEWSYRVATWKGQRMNTS